MIKRHKQGTYNFKLEGYQKKKLWYRDNRDKQRRRCIPMFTSRKEPNHRWRGVGYHEGLPERCKSSACSLSPSMELEFFSLWLSFTSLRSWQTPQPLHNPHEEETYVSL